MIDNDFNKKYNLTYSCGSFFKPIRELSINTEILVNNLIDLTSENILNNYSFDLSAEEIIGNERFFF